MGPVADEEPPVDDKPFDDEPFDAGVEASEEEDPKKFIQQLSGKLGQSLRKHTQKVGLDLELEKFAINSLLSATHTSEMDEEDQQDIIKRVQNSGDAEGGDDDMETSDSEMEDPGITGASNPASAPAPEGGGGAPMGETFETLPKEHKQVFKNAKLGVSEDVDIAQNNEDDENFITVAELEKYRQELANGNQFVGEENGENDLSVNNKKDSFVDNSVERMINDYLNTQNGFEPEVEPQTKPEVAPETKPKVPRRSRPYRVRPNTNPTPKGRN